MNGNDIDYIDFEKMIDFVRNYTYNHHGKEEKILFNKMIDEIGGTAEKLVRFGRHIDKEDTLLQKENYPLKH